jgi:hypothetical protein
MNVEKVLAVAALVALGGLACTVEVVQTATGGAAGTGGAPGRGGSAGSTATGGAAGPDGASGADVMAGASGSAGAGGSTGGAGAAGTGGSGGLAGTGGAPSDGAPGDRVGDTSADTADAALPDSADASACFVEDTDGGDAGNAGTCAMLPYDAAMCGDAGADGRPAGAALCRALEPDLKAAALDDLYACLKGLPSGDGGVEACSAAHDAGARACSQGIFSRSACPVPSAGVDGGTYGCAQIAASCQPEGGSEGVTVEQCQAWLGPFNRATRQVIIDCYLDPFVVGATSCRDKFENFCVFPE